MVCSADPIEVGALAAVLAEGRDSSAAVPVSLHAGKTKIGHSEAAAGVSGLVHGLLSVTGAHAQTLLHLQAANPHLEAALASPNTAWSLPRQGYGLPWSGSVQPDTMPVTGVSSFAFQGRRTISLYAPCHFCTTHCQQVHMCVRMTDMLSVFLLRR